MYAIKILKTAEFIPPGVLGTAGLANKKELLRKLRRYRRALGVLLVVLYAVAAAVVVTSAVLASRQAPHVLKGVLPYVGGAAFVGLLELARRLTKDWVLLTLPLQIAEHASDEQLSNFVDSVLAGFGSGEEAK